MPGAVHSYGVRPFRSPGEIPKPSPLSQRSDSELAALVADQGGDGLTELYWRYATPLLRLAYGVLGSEHDAEDVVQDVFVGLPFALGRYEERGAFAGWLKQLTTRTALMHLRRRAIRRTDSLDADASNDHPARPDHVLERIDLESAIASLPEPLRVVFVLSRVEQLTHDEIAGVLGIRRGTSEVRLHRAIRRLRQLLEERP
jgi:RNA polymerase sigma-70 factor (ECF subfamily)